MRRGRCPYYFEQPQADGEGEPVAYCEHKHSPVNRFAVLRNLDGAQVLTCKGDFAGCQVPAPLRLDTK